MQRLTLREWIKEFNAGHYENPSFDTQCKAGWYDWFCKNSSLSKKTAKFGKILKDIKDDFILDNYYIWFKNNCPCVGPLYDDIRFEPIDESKREELYFVVIIDDKRENAKYCIWTHKENDIIKTAANKKELLQKISELAKEYS